MADFIDKAREFLGFDTRIIKSGSSSKIGDLAIDASISESHKSTATGTKNPVEDGADYTDHIIVHPDTFNMRVFWSDYEGEVKRGRARDQYAELKALQKARTVITVVSGIEIYEKVYISEVGTLQDSTTGHGLYVDCSFEAIETVGIVFRDLTPDEIIKHGVKESKNKGAKKNTKTPDANTAKQAKADGEKSSILYDLGAHDAVESGVESAIDFFGGS